MHPLLIVASVAVFTAVAFMITGAYDQPLEAATPQQVEAFMALWNHWTLRLTPLWFGLLGLVISLLVSRPQAIFGYRIRIVREKGRDESISP
jgi:hypothetical protein